MHKKVVAAFRTQNGMWENVTNWSSFFPRKNHLLAKSCFHLSKVKNILKSSLDSIPSPSVEIQIMGGKVYLR